MLSRAANAIYWMSRYLERAENVARFIDVNLHLILDIGMETSDAQWAPLVAASGDHEDFTARYGKETSQQNVIRFLTFDEENPNAILSCIRMARENARTIRESISTEMWEQLNDIYHTLLQHRRKRKLEDLQKIYQQVKTASHVFIGVMDNTMSHGEGWHFARLGRMLERADKTLRMLDVKYFLLLPSPDYVDSPYDAVQWSALLKSVDAFEMYRQRFHRINYKDVTDFLLFDPDFPRSVRFCVIQAATSLWKIADTWHPAIPAAVQALQEDVDNRGVGSVLRQGLHEYIDTVQQHINVLDNAIFQAFFALTDAQPASGQLQASQEQFFS